MKISTAVWVGLITATVGSLIALGISYLYVKKSLNEQAKSGVTGAVTGSLLSLIGGKS